MSVIGIIGAMEEEVAALKEKMEILGYSYYWCIGQCEFATDINFKTRNELDIFYKKLVETSFFTFSSEDIYSFFGRNISRIHTFTKGEIVSDLRNRYQGYRIKFKIDKNQIKMYDKGNNLRIEVTINNPTDFKVLKEKEVITEHQILEIENRVNDKIKEIYTNSANASFFNAIVGNAQNIMYKVEGYKLNDLYGYVRRCSYMGGTNSGRTSQCQILNGVWSEWESFSTTADLANYLPLTGGIISGDVTQTRSSATSVKRILQNTVRNITEYVNADGQYTLADGTNNKNIIVSTADGTNTFNGTATGNLPLTGGEINAQNMFPVTFSNNQSNNENYLRFKANGAKLGDLGFNGADNPCYVTTTGYAKTLLHTGTVQQREISRLREEHLLVHLDKVQTSQFSF